MSAFVDASALVKLYADETGFEVVRAIDVMVVSCLCRVEVPAAFWRKRRIGELDASSTGILVRAFEADYFGDADEPGRFLIVGLPDGVLDDAARFVAAHGLRAYDGVQLASAAAAREADPELASFACFDEDLGAAAAAEAFATIG